MARREELWTVKVGKRIAKLKRTREQIAGLAALAEHARAVRIVKTEINAVKRDRHNYSTTTRVEMVKRLEGLLAKLERDRGGKG